MHGDAPPTTPRSPCSAPTYHNNFNLIWSPCEVVKVADGTSDKASERCKKMLPAGAGLVKWAGNTGQVVAELKVVTSNKLCEPIL